MSETQARRARERQAAERERSPLSKRQLQAVRLCGEGKSINMIASIMDVQAKTVEGLLYQAGVRLGTTGHDARGDTLAEARRLGLIPDITITRRPTGHPRSAFDDYVPGASNQGRSGNYPPRRTGGLG